MDSARSNDIESITQQWRKSEPPILSTSQCEFNGARSCAHARKTIPLAPIHSFTKHIVPSMYEESVTWSRLISMTPVFRMLLINSFLPSKNILGACHFFLYFHFHRTPFSWACRSWCEPQKFSLFVHSLVCQITHSFLNRFQPNLYQHFSHACSTCYTILSLK